MEPTGLILPQPDQDTAPFWDGCAEGRLLIQRCRTCGKARWYPRPICRHCLSLDFDWVDTTGRASLMTWTVIHQAYRTQFRDAVPYIVAIVELEEGVRMVTNLHDITKSDLQAGMALQVGFVEIEGVSLPVFRPA